MKGFDRFGRLKENKTMVYAIYLLIFIAAFLLRLYNIDYRDVWMDEDNQSGYASGGLFDLDITKRAAQQSQPPMDYMIQSVAIPNFGINEKGIRIHSAFLGALSVLLFYILMNSILENRFVVILASVVFAFHPWLIHYSRVGRPVGAGVFFAVLYLWVLLRFLVQAKDKKTNKRNFIVLVIVQTWFLLSVGFQPLVFVLTSSLSLLPFLLNKKYFYKTAAVYLSSFISFLLAYPILKLVIDKNAQKYLNQAPLLDQVVKFFKNLTAINFETYINYYKPLVENYTILYFIGLILGFAGFMYAVILKKKDTHRLLFSYFLVFTLVHPLLFESLFQTMIKYKVQPRYYLSLIPVLIAGLAVGLHYALSFLTHWLKKNKSRLPGIKYIPHGLLLLLFFLCFYGNLRSLSETYMIQNREWGKVYELFKYHSAPGDTAYIFNLCKPGKWVPTYFYSQKFYYNDESQRYVCLKPKTNIGEDFQNIARGKQRGNIFLLVLKGEHRLKKSYFENLDDITIHHFYKVFIVRFFNNGRMPKNILDFFYRLAKIFPKWENFYMVYETLFRLEMGAGNLRKAELHLKTLNKIATHDKLKKKIKKFEQEWQHKKTQRIKRIEKRKRMKRNIKR